MPPNIAGGQKERGTRGEGLENVADDEKENSSGKGWLDWGKEAMGSVLGGNKEYEGINEGLGFSDVAPYLVISTKSWEEASRRLPEGEEMDITKFRPNIVIEGAEEEYEEDYWAELEIGNRQEGRVAKFVLTNNCARCNSLNVDFKTGKVGEGESGKMLKKLNSNRRVDQGAKWSPVFGRYGFLARVDGGSGVEIKVGDEVRVLSRNDKHTRFGEWLAVVCEPGLTEHRMATTQHEQLMSALKSTSWILRFDANKCTCRPGVVGFASSTELPVRNHIRTFLLPPCPSPSRCRLTVSVAISSTAPSVLAIAVTSFIIALTPVLVPASSVGSQNLLHNLALSNSTLAQ